MISEMDKHFWTTKWGILDKESGMEGVPNTVYMGLWLTNKPCYPCHIYPHAER